MVKHTSFFFPSFFSVLEVSFQRSIYRVVESEGPVQTCLQMNCKAAKNVTVTISAQESDLQQAIEVKKFLCMTANTTRHI